MSTTRVGLFDVIDPPSPASLSMVEQVLDLCTFPFSRLLPAMRARNLPAIPVRWVELPANRNGQWLGAVLISRDLHGNSTIPRWVFGHEVGHCVEEWTLSNQTREALKVALHGRTTDLIDHGLDVWGPTGNGPASLSEAAADLFVAVFAPSIYPYDRVAGDKAHWPADVDATRSIWLADPIAPFTDVPIGSPDFEATAFLADRGITTGKADGRFDGGAAMTRSQMAAMLYRFWRAIS